MSDDATRTAERILADQTIASLGTLHAGEPAVSMVPFAVAGGGVVIHVSGLASHTADMLAHPRVGLMIVEANADDVMPQARARVSITGDAERLLEGGAEQKEARAAYLARFPDAAPIFELGDFSLFAIRPRSVRVVGGFGRAATLSPEQFASALAGLR
ncbi:MAG TPA: pyridoxamine 5'-phosphate oxidase family protein [Thermoanaerobaculia bacterium]|nr:pyridoxamine 5'-phosphate oxidase family protein [Thermoanaerobaculia bacterium]